MLGGLTGYEENWKGSIGQTSFTPKIQKFKKSIKKTVHPKFVAVRSNDTNGIILHNL